MLWAKLLLFSAHIPWSSIVGSTEGVRQWRHQLKTLRPYGRTGFKSESPLAASVLKLRTAVRYRKHCSIFCR